MEEQHSLLAERLSSPPMTIFNTRFKSEAKGKVFLFRFCLAFVLFYLFETGYHYVARLDFELGKFSVVF